MFTCATPLQEAVAIGFEQEIEKIGKDDSYWKILASDLQTKRNRMVDILLKANMNPTIPEGGYFLLADFTKLAQNCNYLSEPASTKDYNFVRWLSINKVTSIIF